MATAPPSPTDHSVLLRASLPCSFIPNHASSSSLSETHSLPVRLPLPVSLMWSFSSKLSHVTTDRIVLNERGGGELGKGIGAMLDSPSGAHHQPPRRAITLQTNSGSQLPLTVISSPAWVRRCATAVVCVCACLGVAWRMRERRVSV